MNPFDDHLNEITVTDYMDGVLAPDERLQVENHLAVCPDCAAQVTELRTLFTALDDLPDLIPRRDIAPLVVAALHPATPPLYRPRPLRWVLALQSAVVLVLSLLAGYLLMPQWLAFQQNVRGARIELDITPLVASAQSLWQAWSMPLQVWREIDPSSIGWLPTLPMTTAAALFMLTFLLWVVCNRFLLPTISLTIPRRTP